MLSELESLAVLVPVSTVESALVLLVAVAELAVVVDRRLGDPDDLDDLRLDLDGCHLGPVDLAVVDCSVGHVVNPERGVFLI